MKWFMLSVFLGVCIWRSIYANNATTTPPFSSTSKGVSSSTTATTPVYTESHNGTSTTVAPTTTPAISCTQRNSSCEDCVKDIKCFWCGADDTCQVYPASKIIPNDCKGNDWFWKQCFAAGKILIYVVPSVCFVVLLTLGCCIYCLCCRNRRAKSYEREDGRIQRRREETRQRNADRRAERRQKTDAIRQKYGLLKDDDDAEVA